MGSVIIRHKDEVEVLDNVEIVSTGKQYRIKRDWNGRGLPRAVRIQQILKVIEEHPDLSYRAIGRKIGLDDSRVYHLIKEENIQR